MEELLDEIYQIAEKDSGTLAEHLGKLTEETGEFARAVNMINGRKTRKNGETDEEVDANLVEEAADVIQVVLSILKKRNISPIQLFAALAAKNKTYAAFVEKLNKK